jgi:mono/diheme cytochrome c family protein
MARFSFAILLTGLLYLGLTAGLVRAELGAPAVDLGAAGVGAGPQQAAAAQPDLVSQYCVRCHNDSLQRGNLTLESFDSAHPETDAATAEKMIRKLRAGMMPPPGSRRPDPATIAAFATLLETRVDAAASVNPNPGSRPFQRLNRAEYSSAVRDLLGMDIDAGLYLPPDTISAGFDNIADVQNLSATLLDGYLRAADDISRLAVGDPDTTASDSTYEVSRYAEQRTRVDGAPIGTRGGVAVIHYFPADGSYIFRVSLQHESTGNLFGNGRGALHTAEQPEQIEISINGERQALLDVDRWAHRSEADSMEMETVPIFVRAGPQRVAAAFLQRFEGPVEDLVSPHEWSLADKKIGYAYGVTALPHMRDMVINGPHNPTGVSETPSRRAIFTCRPTAPDEALPCAEAILTRLGTIAYRRPLADEDLDPLLSFYRGGAEDGGFEVGIRTALHALLASPDFVFRFEVPAAGVEPGEIYRLNDLDVASRLSFFLWGASPDDELLALARENRLSEPDVLDAEVRRMLADPRADALGSRFAAQWLRLQDLDTVHPDSLAFPDFHDQLARSMHRETELFFNNLVAEDRNVLELLTADYTFIDERLARHYGIAGVRGDEFQRVTYPDDTRRGVLGHGSVLTLTSHANRTSPVLRGKWVMEVLMGTPPPPPPPDVPDLEEIGGAKDGRFLSTREMLEAHRANPTCNSCHRVMDPIGLALDGFDVTGRWRIRDNGVPVDTRGELYDGTPINGPADLRRALVERSDVIVANFTENLMAYALGRRVEYYDMPTVRAIMRAADAGGNRMTDFILGVVRSPAFGMARVPPDTPEDISRR